MSTDANKALIRQLVDEVQVRGNMEVADEYLSPDFVNHSAAPGISPDRDGAKQFFALFLAAFPDLEAIIHDQVAEGDKVVTRKTLHGTHQGDFMGIPPTGNKVAVEIIDILRIVNGKVTEHWAAVDQLGMLQQLGVIPTPGQPTS